MTAIIIILDGIGAGPEPDAKLYGDENANTLNYIIDSDHKLTYPTMESIGLIDLIRDPHSRFCSSRSIALTARHKSPGKGSTLGHWELVGQVRQHDFAVNHGKLDQKFILQVQDQLGLRTLHNAYSPSGQKLVESLGSKSIDSGSPILYTSDDSVLQIAASEEIIPPKDLYSMARALLKVMRGNNEFGRVICRPFVTRGTSYKRTGNRRDFHQPPPNPNLLSILLNHGKKILAGGIAADIFGSSNYSRSYKAPSIEESISTIIEAVQSNGFDLIITNISDFDDALHLNDIKIARSLMSEFDFHLRKLLSELSFQDFLIITSDHGCDPTINQTSHTRELSPVLICPGFENELNKLLPVPFYLAGIPEIVFSGLGLDEIVSVQDEIKLMKNTWR